MSLESVLLEYGAAEVSAMDVYSDIFRLGSGFIQTKGEPGGEHKANPIVLGEFGGEMRRRILFEDTFEETLAEFQSADWAITNGLTYWGRANTAQAQSKMCAMIFDLDGQDDGGKCLKNFLHGCLNGEMQLYPTSQYVTLSGHNVYLYYVFEEPLSLYPNTKTQLKALKYALTDRMWNMHTSSIEKPQHQGINQGFRIIGGRTKLGTTVRAFRLDAHPTTVGELNRFVADDCAVDLSKPFRDSKYTLEQARVLFPDWYERVVEGGDESRRPWFQKEDLYRWWLRRCATPWREEGNLGDRHVSNAGVTYGHRYFAVMTLAIFAVKCGITDRERVKADAMSLLPLFNMIRADAPFTEADVDSALECLDLRYIRFPRKDLERITAMPMPPNKRNGRKMQTHLRMARSNLAILNEEAGRALQGRPRGSGTKRDAIREYAEAHPDANHSQIAKALGVSRPTVIKWLKDA